MAGARRVLRVSAGRFFVFGSWGLVLWRSPSRVTRRRREAQDRGARVVVAFDSVKKENAYEEGPQLLRISVNRTVRVA